MANPMAITSGLRYLCVGTLSYLGYFIYQNNQEENTMSNEDYEAWLELSLASSDKINNTAMVEHINMDNYVKLNESNWFVYIYTPWSYWCNVFEHTWTSLLERMYHLHPHMDIKFASIDADSHPGLAAWLQVVHYPSLILIRNGSMRPYYHYNKSLALLEEYLLDDWQKQRVKIQLGDSWSIWYEFQIRIWNSFCVRQMQLYEMIIMSIPREPWVYGCASLLLLIVIWLTLIYMKWVYKKFKQN